MDKKRKPATVKTSKAKQARALRIELFADALLADPTMNVTKAAIAAGYAVSGAHVRGSRMMKEPEVIAALERRRRIMEAKTEVNRDRVIAELAKIAFLDPRKFFEEDGTLKPLSAIDDDTAAALAGIDVTELKAGKEAKGFTKAIKISDKRGALETLCKVLGYFAPEKHLVRTQDVGDAEIIFE